MEPERQIEKLLRAMAKKRRDQAGDALELRPSAREQLQREVSRRGASKSGGGFLASLFSGFIPRLAVALCVLAIVGFGVWWLSPLGSKQQPSTLAMNEDSFSKAAPAARREMAAPPPPSSPVPVVAENNPNSAPPAAQMSPPASPAADKEKNASSAPVAGMSLQAEARDGRKQSVAAADTLKQPAGAQGSIASTSPVPATQSAPALAENAPSALFDATPPSGTLAGAPNQDKDATRKTVEAPAPGFVTNGVVFGATIAAAEPEAQKKLAVPQPSAFYRANRAAVSDGLASFGSAAPAASNSQSFRRTVPATIPHTAGTSTASPVLTSFQVVQDGQQVRVVDADGSIYTGSFTTPEKRTALVPPVTISGVAPAATAAAKAEAPRAMAQSYFFRVAGTNLNLNQTVVFSGNLIPLANVPQVQSSAVSGGVGGGGGGGGGYGPGVPGTSLLLNSRIAGKAIIGGKKEIEVNATPAR